MRLVNRQTTHPTRGADRTITVRFTDTLADYMLNDIHAIPPHFQNLIFVLTVSLQGIQARTIREAVLGADRETEGEREQGCQRSYVI